MADKQHLKILLKGVGAWNQWRKENPDRKPDLIGANLTNANLNRANFYRANLTSADLSSAELIGADFYRANLNHSNFSSADLSSAEFYRANLRNANLTSADLSSVNFTDANLKNANLSSAYISSADLIGADLTSADLRDTNLYRADLISADLTSADLTSADLIGTNLIGTNLSSANLIDTSLIRSQALNTNFENANLTGACIEDWNINSQTNLENVKCDYIYLKEKQEDRRPHNGNFKEREFTQLFQKALETVDLIFSEGIEWTAFLESFQQLQAEVKSEDLSIQAIEKKSGGTFIVRLEVPKKVNKAEIEKYIKEKYEVKLKAIEASHQEQLIAKDKKLIQAYQKNSTDMLKVVEMLSRSQKQTIINNQGDIEMAGDTYNQSGNFGIGHMSGGEIQDNAEITGEKNIYTSEQKQTLAQAAEEIQKLLKQLEQTNPDATKDQQIEHINDETTPKFKRKAFAALKAAGDAAIDEFLQNPYAKVGKAAIMGWLDS